MLKKDKLKNVKPIEITSHANVDDTHVVNEAGKD